jgi:hypothetical protein
MSLAPVTVAVNCWLPSAERLTAVGDIVIVTAANVRDGSRNKIPPMRNDTVRERERHFFNTLAI